MTVRKIAPKDNIKRGNRYLKHYGPEMFSFFYVAKSWILYNWRITGFFLTYSSGSLLWNILGIPF